MRLPIATLLISSVALAFPVDSGSDSKQALMSYFVAESPSLDTKAGWIDARINGGQFLDFTYEEWGEPLNIIISGHSDPYILSEHGLHVYANSLGYSDECLGLHYGNRHMADLGDGDGKKVQQFLARQRYFPIWGTCWESLAGGHHFRAWKQNGSLANTGAWFLGASKELDSTKHHTIVPNGYNQGRDWLVQRAVEGTRWKGMLWKAEVEMRTGLLPPGDKGVNHHIAQDGIVAILTVQRVDNVECPTEYIFALPPPFKLHHDLTHDL